MTTTALALSPRLTALEKNQDLADASATFPSDIPAISAGNSWGQPQQRTSYDLSFDLSRFSPRQLLSRESFDYYLSPGDDQGNGASTIWGRGSVRGFKGLPNEGFEHSGNLVSAYLGMDQRVTADTLLGVALGQSWGGLDYAEKEAGPGRTGA